MIEILRGLLFLDEVTGIRGLLARNAVPRDDPAARNSVDTPWHDAASHYERFVWRADVSRDQYAGALFGYAMAFFAFPGDAEIESLVAQGSSAIADHLIQNGYRIVDPDGRPTKHGDLRHRFGGIVPIGVNATISLLALEVARLSTDDGRYSRAKNDLVARGAAGAVAWSKFQIFGKTNHNNDNMQFLTNWPLVLLERDPATRRLYLAGLARTWEYVRLEGNSFFTYAAATVLPVEPRALGEAKDTLLRFPAEKRSMIVDVTDRAEFGRFPFTNRKGTPRATGAIPISYRAPTSFAWRDDPYELVSGRRPDGGLAYAGADYLLAYWLGRAAGFLTESD